MNSSSQPTTESNSTRSSSNHTIQYLWQLLTEPAREVAEPGKHRQARLLASLLVFLIPLGTVSIISQIATSADFLASFTVILPALIVLVITYILSRTRYYSIAAFIAAAIPIIASIANLVADPTDIIGFAFLTLGVALASLLLDMREIVLFAIATILGALGLIIFVLGFNSMYIGPFSFVLITSVFMTLSAFQRNQIEADRHSHLIQARASLRQSEEQLRNVLQNMPVMMVAFDEDRNVLVWNRESERLTNYSAAETIGNPDFMQWLFPDESYRNQILANWEKREDYYYNWEWEITDKTGEKKIILWSTIAQQFPIPSWSTWGIGVDITARKQAEHYIIKNNRELKLLHNVIRVATSTLKTEVILDEVCRELALAFEVPLAFAAMFEKELTEIRIVTGHVPESFPNPVGMVVSATAIFQTSLGQEFLKNEIPFIIDNPQENSDLESVSEIINMVGVASFMLLPLIIDDHMVGVLAVASDQRGAFAVQQIELAKNVASSVSQALHNAQLYHELTNYRDILEQAVTDRTTELEAANQHLQKLSRVKDEFVSNVSHELRTPIANLKLQTYLLKHKPQKLLDHVTVIEHETERLEAIIENLLRLSRLDQEREVMLREIVDLNLIVSQQIADRVSLFEQQGLILIINSLPEAVLVSADAGLLNQVLSILLTNASQYTPKGGTIEVKVKTQTLDGQSWTGFTVSDTGPGVSMQDQTRLFERFFRGDTGQQFRLSGTGLGLAIAKEIVDRHQGRIEVSSDGIPGKGAQFSVLLPISNAP